MCLVAGHRCRRTLVLLLLLTVFWLVGTRVSADPVDEYTLSLGTVGDGSVGADPDQDTYVYGEVVTLTATAGDAPWFFATWSGAATGDTNPTTVTILGNAIVTATFGYQIPPREYAALVALYDSAGGDDWTESWGLPTVEPCLLYGITCDGGHVTELELNQNNLVGAIPTELGDLEELTTLWLDDNSLSGSIPSELGQLAKLENLWICSNGLSGGIPTELGNLTSLEWLDLGGNALTGTIPSELGALSGLAYLFLEDNKLSGAIPAELSGLTNLEWLYLYGNELTGELPSYLGTFTNLEALAISSNHLTGTIPSQLGNLTGLTSLFLSDNKLSGQIPSELGDLTALTQLVLGSNALEGAIPGELANLAAISDLDLSHNMLSASGASLVAWLDAHDADWADTQTVPPIHVVATPAKGGAILSWDPIAYTGNGGGYEVLVSDTLGGPYTKVARTASKLEDEARVDGLEVGRTYYAVVRTHTPTHALQQTELYSAYSAEVRFDPLGALYLPCVRR